MRNNWRRGRTGLQLRANAGLWLPAHEPAPWIWVVSVGVGVVVAGFLLIYSITQGEPAVLASVLMGTALGTLCYLMIREGYRPAMGPWQATRSVLFAIAAAIAYMLIRGLAHLLFGADWPA